MNNLPQNSLAFPIAVILAGIIIAIGILFLRGNFLEKPAEIENTEEKESVGIRPITSQDKILGNPNADVLIVEYSDFECPYCQAFHKTMNRLIDEYGREGKVAWVYRHFPLEPKHTKAKGAAIASECVFELNGNESFWQYAEIVFASAPESLSEENLKKIATDLGVKSEDYDLCLKRGDIIQRVENDIKDGNLIAEKDREFGTPYSFVITKTGIQTKIIGNQNYQLIRELIESFI